MLAEAERAGARRFVYVGVFTEVVYADTAYVKAHARVEAAIRESGLEYGFVRTTGVFGSLAEMLPMALKGPVPVIGDGSAVTNPIGPSTIWLTAKRDFSVRIQGAEIKTSLDGVHFDRKPAVPGHFQLAIQASREGGMQVVVRVTTPVHAKP